MAKTQQAYAEAAASNTSLTDPTGAAIPLAEGQMMPRHVNDAVRALMADTAVAAKASGLPAQRTNTFAVKIVTDSTSAGSFPAVNGSKLEIDGALNPAIALAGTTDATFTYEFDTSDSSVTGNLQFYEDAAQSTAYTVGVTVTGTAGTAGAKTSIVVTETTPRVLYYQIAGTAGLGGLAVVLASDQAAASVSLDRAAAETAATTATTQAGIATTQASNAATEAGNAATSASQASSSVTTAASHKNDAYNYTYIAGTQPTNNAEYFKSQAETAATNALAYRNTAEGHKNDAETAYQNILTSQDDNLWLGGFAATAYPTTDNNGNALLTGAALYDTTNNAVRVYNGSSWVPVIGAINLNDLADVSVASPSNGQGIAWNSANSQWQVATLGGAPSTDANNDITTGTDGGSFLDLSASSSLATVATTGAYSDLTGTPSLATVATSGAYSDLSGTPSLATVATSGAYGDLTGTPSLATVATSGAYADLTGTPTLATVATTGASTDLTDTANLVRNNAGATLTGDYTISGNLDVTSGEIRVDTIDPDPDGNGGTLTILGNLQVDGTTTTLNSTELVVDDLNITVASGAANAAAANGAGLTVDGANATFNYASTGDKWTANKDIDVGTNKLYFSNVFTATTDLPTASNYHGMFAHVHNEGAAYYAHGGNWIKLANYSDLSSAGASDLDGLSDVTLGTAATGEVLRYNGSAWVDAQLAYSDLSGTPTIPAALGDLNNVASTSPSNGQTLSYNSTTSEWEPSTPSSGVTTGKSIAMAIVFSG